MKIKVQLLAIPLLVLAMVVGTPQVAQAAYTYIFYKSGNGTNNTLYFSAFQNGIAGGYAGSTSNDGYVWIQTQNAFYAYATAVGNTQTYLSHATLNNYQSVCKFYGSSVSPAPLSCEWRQQY